MTEKKREKMTRTRLMKGIMCDRANASMTLLQHLTVVCVLLSSCLLSVPLTPCGKCSLRNAATITLHQDS